MAYLFNGLTLITDYSTFAKYCVSPIACDITMLVTCVWITILCVIPQMRMRWKECCTRLVTQGIPNNAYSNTCVLL